MSNFIVDVETLDVESTSVILSCAVIKFELDEVPNFNEFCKRALFVKFKAGQQINELKRTIRPATIDWWAKQSKAAQEMSVRIYTTDLPVKDGMKLIRAYAGLMIDSSKNRHVKFWSRGALDQVTLDSLAKAGGEDILIPYNNWYDIRTAVDLLHDGKGGYVDVPGFNDMVVTMHNPIHDCARDLMMLLKGNINKDDVYFQEKLVPSRT